MMARILVAIVLAASLGGCARGPKQPWGWVREPVNKSLPADVIVRPDAKGRPGATASFE